MPDQQTLQKNPNNGLYAITQDSDVVMQSKPSYYGIQQRDWKKLEKHVNQCSLPNETFSNIAFTMFGISGSAFVSWLTLLSVTVTVELWIKCIVFLIAIVTIVMGLVCLYFNSKEKTHYQADINNVKEEISDINASLLQKE